MIFIGFHPSLKSAESGTLYKKCVHLLPHVITSAMCFIFAKIHNSKLITGCLVLIEKRYVLVMPQILLFGTKWTWRRLIQFCRNFGKGVQWVSG